MECKTTVIIVTYNSDDTIDSNLDSLEYGNSDGRLKVIVVDNDSRDQTKEIIKERYPWVELIENEENLGYGRGLNLGLQEVKTPYTLFMNPDAIFPYQEIRKLEDFISGNVKIGMLAPAIKRRNGSYQESGILMTPRNILLEALGQSKIPRNRKPITTGEAPYKTDWLCGAIMFCPTILIKKINGFDPRFFLYFEETDLCVRIMKEGYDLYAVGEALAIHESNSSARKVDPTLETGGCLYNHFYQSRYYFMRKHYGLLVAFLTEMTEIIIYGIKDLLKIMFRRKKEGKFLERLKYPVFHSPVDNIHD